MGPCSEIGAVDEEMSVRKVGTSVGNKAVQHGNNWDGFHVTGFDRLD